MARKLFTFLLTTQLGKAVAFSALLFHILDSMGSFTISLFSNVNFSKASLSTTVTVNLAGVTVDLIKYIELEFEV